MLRNLFKKNKFMQQKYSFTHDELMKIVNEGYIQGAIDFNDRNMNDAFNKFWNKMKIRYKIL